MPQTTPVGTTDGRLTTMKFIPLLSVVIVLIAACGGSSPTALPAPKPSASDTAALDLLKRSTEIMENIESFRSHTEVEGRVLGEDVSISMDMEVDGNNGMHNVMEIHSPDGKMTIEQIIISPDVFTKVSGAGGRWIRMDIEDVAREAGVPVEVFADSAVFFTSLFPGDEVPWDLYTVRLSGTANLDGVNTQHLNIDVDFQELWGRLNAESRQQLTQGMGPLGSSLMGDSLSSTQYEDIEMWIDDQGLLRRTTLSISVGENMRIAMDMRMRDFDKSIVITQPSQYQDLR